MQGTLWGAALTVVLLTGQVFGQASGAIHCNGLDPTAPGDAGRAFECVSKLSADLASLSQRLAALETRRDALPAIPSGAVVAFDTGCPREGWTRYRKTHGRMVIGATENSEFMPEYRDSASGTPLARRKAGEHGGEEAVALSTAEMPAHSHITSPPTAYNPTKYRHWGPWGWSNHRTADFGHAPHFRADSADDKLASRYPLTSPAGESKPHPNMPPFIALYFCQKD